MEIKPDKKLFIKQLFVLLTISIFVVIVALILQLLIPLKQTISSNQAAVIIWPITIGSLLLMWIISIPIIYLWIKNLCYFIEEDRVTIYKGILTKQQQNIPYRAITDFALRRSLYDRFLGIGSIRIQTAGQGQPTPGYEGQLSGLLDWENLHQELRNKLSTYEHHIDAKTVSGQESFQGDKTDLIVEELRAIRKVLEKNN